MSSWQRRGLPHEKLTMEQSNCLIRCDPSDGMNGFFIALFMKKCPIGNNNYIPVASISVTPENDKAENLTGLEMIPRNTVDSGKYNISGSDNNKFSNQRKYKGGNSYWMPVSKKLRCF